MIDPFDDHSFVVPAYGKSAHLERCLESLRAQTHPSPIFISTSTPFRGLSELADRFQARVTVHDPNAGIGNDWNNAIRSADSNWITLAHQDDVYLPDFAHATKSAIRSNQNALLVFTGYRELLGDRVIPGGTLLLAKRALQEFAFLGRSSVMQSRAKRRLLAFGCAIPCPSVTMRRLPGFVFSEKLAVNLDWDAWLRLACPEGAFVRVNRKLMLHRLHAGSETFNGTQAGVRQREDQQLFEQLWPKIIARFFTTLYSMSYRRALN